MAGSSNYPTSVDNKTALTDGVDIIQADDVNNAYVPLNSIETFVGVSGAAQSHNIDIVAFLENQLPRITLSYDDADTIVASIGVVCLSNASGSIKKLRKCTVATDITFTDLDTGARAVSTQYYVYATGDSSGTSPVFKISTSASAPTGYTNYKKIGKFKTNSTGSGEVIKDSIFSEGSFNINFPEQVIKARASIDGDASPAVLRDSFNISSITDNGTGDYTLTFIVPFADTNYTVVGTAGGGSAANARFIVVSKSTTSCQIQVLNTANSAVDHDMVEFIALGDQ